MTSSCALQAGPVCGAPVAEKGDGGGMCGGTLPAVEGRNGGEP